MLCPKIGFLPEPISLSKIKRGNPSRKNGPRKNGWTMIPNRTLEEKSYVSLAKNHGYQVTDVQGRERLTTWRPIPTMGRMMIIRIRSRERHLRQLRSSHPQEEPLLP